MRKLFAPLVATLSILMAAEGRAQSALDGFDPNANGQVRVVVVQPDGKILFGGDFTTLAPNGGGPVTRNHIARLNPDGTLDTAFDPSANSSVYAIAVQADGKILVGGGFGNIGGQTRTFMARLDATTGLADSFAPNPNNTVYAIAVQADGKILAGGGFTAIAGQTRNKIARLDATTGLADSFAPNADNDVHAIVAQSDGKILAGGFFTGIGGQVRNFIARLDDTTALADSFNPNANGHVESIVLQADGKILAGGTFTTIGGQIRNFIARLDGTAGLADSFNPGVNNVVNSIAVQADGRIVAGGVFTSIGGQPRNHIARFDAATGLVDSLNPNANGNVLSVAVQADGRILAGGVFTGIGGQTRNFIARLYANASIATPPNRFGRVSTRAFVGTGNDLLIGGFVVSGNAAKKVLVRVLGPSLPGVPGQLTDPTLELRNDSGGLVASNDNWRDSQEAEIIATGQAPPNDLESAVLVTLSSGVYTALAAGKNNTTGVGRVEIIDVDASNDSQLLNISSRAFAQTGNNVIIGGFTIDGPQSQKVLLRGIGPSLSGSIANALADPTLELRNGSGNTLVFNNDWQENPAQAAEIIATGIQPTNALESALIATLSPGSYTAALAGVCNTTGIAIFEVYNLGLTGNTTAIPASSPLPCLPTPTPPVITSPLTATGTVGQPFLYQFVALGATSLSVTNPPPDLTFSTGLSALTGIPATAGTFPVGLSASNIAGTTTATLTITVQPAPTAGPTIQSSAAVTGRVGLPFTFQAYTTGGTSSARISATGLPAGLSIDAVSGRITGITAVEGSSVVTLTVTDGLSVTSSTLQLTFTADPAFPVIVSPGSASLIHGQFFTYSINAPSSADPGTDPTTFALIGRLPQGLSFNVSAGIISGIYTGFPRESTGGGPRRPELAGGTLGSVQLFASNSHGTSTFQLLFLAAPSGAVNISTRLLIGTGENVLIGGFIVTGNAPKVVIVRALGPSTGVPGALPDPILELHDSAGHVVTNDNWRSDQQQIIIDTTIPPTNDLESAIVAGLDPGNYTAIVAGKKGAGGIGLVEVYDLGTASLDTSGTARLAQISTRGLVGTSDNVMIGGFIISGQATTIIVRGIGPSLTQVGIANALADPTLELHDGSGSLIFSNDEWRSTQEQQIIATGVAPTDDHESAIVATLPPGNYTAIVAGQGNTTGVALVEVYALQ